MSAPDSHLLRSPIYRVLGDAGATFATVGGGAVARRFGEPDGPELGRRCGLADLSLLPRIGFKGAGAPKWLESRGIVLPETPNRARRQHSGALVARLSQQEHLVLCDLDGDPAPVEALNDAWSIESAPLCFPLLRRHTHCWFLLTGERMPEMLAKVCGVDLRWHRFEPGSVAQTSVARISAIIIRSDLEGASTFSMLADSASAEYLWGCLVDAMGEFDGGPIGLDTITGLWRGDAA